MDEKLKSNKAIKIFFFMRFRLPSDRDKPCILPTLDRNMQQQIFPVRSRDISPDFVSWPVAANQRVLIAQSPTGFFCSYTFCR
jgi:hypothetical protein